MLLTAFTVLMLLLAANGAPVLGKRLLGARLAAPVDGGTFFLDGRRLLGRSKTWRGIALSLCATTGLAPFLGQSWQVGLIFGTASMAGDLISSFTKRRLNIPPSGRFLGLDQLPEALLPLVICRQAFGLSGFDIVALALVFLLGSLLLSRLMFRLGIRDRPY